ILLLRQQRVAVCRSCRHAVLPGSVRTHVQTRHQDLSTEKRQKIVTQALECEQQGVLCPHCIRYP
ncbi:hypothetical protein QBC38DRAFT_344682, partial [Podospora fimiseda]